MPGPRGSKPMARLKGGTAVGRLQKVSRRRLKKSIPLYFMMSLSLLYFLVNNYIPMAGLVIAFKRIDYRVGILKSPFIGLENFKYLFATDDAWVITRNTLLYNASFIVVNTVLAVIIAIFLNEVRSKGRRSFFQSAVLLPYLISMIIISYIANAFLHSDYGLINRVILPLFGADKVSWYMDAGKWPFILTFVNAWKNVGYLSIIYYSAVIGIDRQLLEAAAIDGASRVKQIFNVTLPLIKPVIITMVLLAVGRIFYSDFGLFYHVPMNTGILYSATNVIDTYVYRGLMQLGNIGMSSAAGLYQSFVGFVLVLASNFAVRRISPENALF